MAETGWTGELLLADGSDPVRLLLEGASTWKDLCMKYGGSKRNEFTREQLGECYFLIFILIMYQFHLTLACSLARPSILVLCYFIPGILFLPELYLFVCVCSCVRTRMQCT